MPRYFIEVAYKGTHYSGFQIQQNANSVQAEIQKALKIFFKKDFELTGSSRTDAGVHALQNFFHFYVEPPLITEKEIKILESSKVFPVGGDLEGAAYNLNSILPDDIVIKKIFLVKDFAHCRFDAISREYKYFIYQKKDPFLQDSAYYFPYKIDVDKLNEAAQQLLKYTDFTSFSKKNTQVNNFICKIEKSEWMIAENKLAYNVIANRFLRGMVKGLVGTMLKVGTNKISVNEFLKIIENKESAKADFSVPPQGLFLVAVNFNPDIFIFH
ncbi:MAG: tRNA pseudouridine(38-40) synthase TruA [Bacteroidota bacterium]|nr:tRNA pseudouridine(38-40) synthase TruA [Bacteroidota bacterium]